MSHYCLDENFSLGHCQLLTYSYKKHLFSSVYTLPGLNSGSSDIEIIEVLKETSPRPILLTWDRGYSNREIHLAALLNADVKVVVIKGWQRFSRHEQCWRLIRLIAKLDPYLRKTLPKNHVVQVTFSTEEFRLVDVQNVLKSIQDGRHGHERG